MGVKFNAETLSRLIQLGRVVASPGDGRPRIAYPLKAQDALEAVGDTRATLHQKVRPRLSGGDFGSVERGGLFLVVAEELN